MRYYLIMIILCFCSTLRAQQDLSANHKLGIKTSVNVSTLVGDEFKTHDLNLDILLGLIISISHKNLGAYTPK